MKINKIDGSAARSFRTALEQGWDRIKSATKRWHGQMSAHTIHGHCRRAKTLFQQALDDDLIASNPFTKVVGTAPVIDKDWEYITIDQLHRLLDACPTQSWRLLLALCRRAGLRQSEALRLSWADIQWEQNRFSVIGKGDRRREVRLESQLARMLLEAHEVARDGEAYVIPPGSISAENLWRDFQFICRRAGITPYARWCHTLRKNRQTDWAQIYPEYVVCYWMGNSQKVARQHYLQVPNHLYNNTHQDRMIVNPV